MVDYYVDGAHTGKFLTPSIPTRNWINNNQGYTCAVSRVPEYQLAKQYIYDVLKLNPSIFAHEYDCWYGLNNSHVEDRGGHRFLRPSLTAKFVLKQGLDKFYSYDWSYAYHGTKAAFVSSIIDNGLRMAGDTLKDGSVVPSSHGKVYGEGIYSSKMPQYSSLYAEVISYKKHYLQIIFMVRLNAKYVTSEGVEGKATVAMLGRDDIYKLYKGILEEKDTQYVVKNSKHVTLQALLVRVLDTHPQYGEYVELNNMLKDIDGY